MSYVHEIADKVCVLVGDTTIEERREALSELLRLLRSDAAGPQCQEAAAEAALHALRPEE
jgi:hypothetical protein